MTERLAMMTSARSRTPAAEGDVVEEAAFARPTALTPAISVIAMYFEPIGKALAAAGIRQPNPMNPAHAWALRSVVPPYLKWVAAKRLQPLAAAKLPQMPKSLREHAEFACERLQRMALEISGTRLHLYGKAGAREGRKMGHLSALGDDAQSALGRALDAYRRLSPATSASFDVTEPDLRDAVRLTLASAG